MNQPTEITEKTHIHTDMKTAVAVVITVFVAAAAYVSIKADIADYGRRLDSFHAIQRADHDILLELRGALKGTDNNPRFKYSSGGGGGMSGGGK